MLDNLLFALAVTAPIFVIFCTGIILKRTGLIDDEFARRGSKLVFTVALPCMLFVKLVETQFDQIALDFLLYALVATIGVFLLLDRGVAPWLRAEDRSAFVQSSFRSNMGIVGLAYCLNAYGSGVLPMASVYLAFMTILYNVLAVITLNRHSHSVNGEKISIATTLKKIAANPLIGAILLALILAWLTIKVPNVILETMNYFAAMTLPLALLCAGAAIRWREFHTSTTLYWATLIKLVLAPGLIVLGAIILGFRGEALGVLYFMTAAPTATASYPMTQAMGGNHFLVAAVIATTSLGSLAAITLGLFVLRALGLV